MASHADTDSSHYDDWVDLDSSGFVRVVRLITEWLWWHAFRLEAHGVEHVPATGACIIALNHSSYLDPFLHVCPLPRVVRFMAKDTVFRNPVLRRFMRAGGAFPVRRGAGDAFAMELARRMLHDGQAVVVYPEGTRFRRSLDLGPGKRGAARLALETGAPVIPGACWGIKDRALYGLPRWRRRRVTVCFGAPIDVSGRSATRDEVDALRDEIWSRVHELYDQARELDAARA